MSDESQSETQEPKKTLLERFNLQDGQMIVHTVLISILGAVLYLILVSIEMPYIMYGLFMFSLAPALAIIAVTGAVRGPIAGLLTGYLGVVLSDFLFYGTIVSMTLPALAYGILGFVAGLASYDLNNGRSLLKLSILSVIGMVFTILLVMVIGITIEGYALLVALGFVMLPLLTVGLPSVFLITPLFARSWQYFMTKFIPA